ncbi:uncharacterized protein G2W53_016154 [Senna tora]|uniref:Uncharacterized protein n=1 Tax=Senna tora TaxID=362788 RepID=A0A835C936_9FABA|nr:uncharacterized protein G2W53_016154 [Senna tora]
MKAYKNVDVNNVTDGNFKEGANRMNPLKSPPSPTDGPLTRP